MSIDQLHYRLGPGNYRKLARLTGYSPSHISRVLRGKVGASLSAATRIADVAGITLDELREYIEWCTKVGDGK